MRNATVYCAAPTSRVLPLIGDPADYIEVEDDNDGIEPYQSLIEIIEPTLDAAARRAEAVAAAVSAAGIDVAIRLDDDAVPYVA